MSDIPMQYNPKGNPKRDLVRLAAFLNGFLTIETLEDLPCPENLKCDYEDLNKDGKREWYEYTLNALFLMAARESFCVLGREPKIVELGLIKRRIVNFFKKAGIELEQD